MFLIKLKWPKSKNIYDVTRYTEQEDQQAGGNHDNNGIPREILRANFKKKNRS